VTSLEMCSYSDSLITPDWKYPVPLRAVTRECFDVRARNPSEALRCDGRFPGHRHERIYVRDIGGSDVNVALVAVMKKHGFQLLDRT
jgi:hypothetical protein